MARRWLVLGCAGLLVMAACARQPATSAPPAAPHETPSAPPTPATPASLAVPSPPGPQPSASPGTTPPPSGAAAESITFVSVSQAWALAKAANGQFVLHTVDRGKHWAVAGTLPAGANVSEIRYANTQDGWAFGPGLYVTHDGGSTWRLGSLTGTVADVEASGGMAWALSSPCGTAPTSPCGAGLTVDRSPVSADTWHALSGLSLPGGQSGTIALHGSAVYLAVGQQLIGSADGTTFAPITDPCPASSDFFPAALTVTNPAEVEVLCAGQPGAGSSAKRVYVSTDSGHTYHPLADAPQGGQVDGFAAASPTTIAISAASGASEIYRTSGAGTTWSTPLTFGDGGAGFADLGFTDSTHGVAVSSPGQNGRVYLTDTAGASWYPVAFKP